MCVGFFFLCLVRAAVFAVGPSLLEPLRRPPPPPPAALLFFREKFLDVGKNIISGGENTFPSFPMCAVSPVYSSMSSLDIPFN